MPDIEEKSPGVLVVNESEIRRKSIHVMIATPTDGGITHNFAIALSKLVIHLDRVGIKYNIQVIPNDSLITRARNTLVALFLANPVYTHMMWIDSDLSFDPDKVERLLTSGKDVAGAAYPLKTTNYEMMARAAKANDNISIEEMKNYSSKFVINTITEDMLRKAMVCDDPKAVVNPSQVQIVEGFTEVSELGTGFLCVRRSAYLKMIEYYSDDYYSTDQPTLREMDKKLTKLGIHTFYTFYDTMIFKTKGHDGQEARRYLSEDYAFCQKWRQTGGKVYCMPDVSFAHTGPVEFHGNYFQHLLNQQKLIQKEKSKQEERSLQDAFVPLASSRL